MKYLITYIALAATLVLIYTVKNIKGIRQSMPMFDPFSDNMIIVAYTIIYTIIFPVFIAELIGIGIHK